MVNFDLLGRGLILQEAQANSVISLVTNMMDHSMRWCYKLMHQHHCNNDSNLLVTWLKVDLDYECWKLLVCQDYGPSPLKYLIYWIVQSWWMVLALIHSFLLKEEIIHLKWCMFQIQQNNYKLKESLQIIRATLCTDQ